ncbi:MAG: hypothetical protein GXY76_21730 [Chloroflexi bacterium]|nr:hypothetical protein [Chloroflexota bacterium]
MAEVMTALATETRAAARAETLRRRCLERKGLLPSPRQDHRHVAASLRASEGVPSWPVRRGLLTRDLLAWFPFALDDQELLLGRMAPDRPEWQAEREEAKAWLAARYPDVFTPGQTGHCELDLSRLLALGLDGLRADVERRLAAAEGAQAETYQSFAHALDGLAVFIEHAADTAEEALPHASPERRAELALMAGACRRVAHQPPATFREALQLLWLAVLAVQHANYASLVQPGHLDRTLWPYYRDDLAAGRLKREGALELLEALYLLLNEQIADGLAIGVMVGGRDAQGRDLTNDLSYLCLEALRRTRLIYPTVGICWHEGTPPELVELAVELIAAGIPNPALFGDETIQRGLRMYGVPPQESWNYVNSTCVEITPSGSSNVWVASPYFSVPKLLLDEIAAQVGASRSGGRGVALTFEEFLARYGARLGQAIAEGAAQQNRNRERRQRHGGKPLQSVLTRDCLERGRDIDDGGARYNWVECSFVGLANLADALAVIREEAYGDGLSLAELKALCDADFAGHEAERQRLLNRHPKYGNVCPEVDELVGWVVALARGECAKQRMLPDDSPFVPGAFCWIQHERLGRECGATPDGRKAGFPFADGGGPAQGREKHGPTSAILSTTCWDHAPLIGGLAYNLKFGKSLFATPEARERLRDLLLTYLRRGGFETQVNVVDAETLRRAQREPEAYRDLVVRIGGYTDYFARLSPQMQSEIIARTEFAGF